MVNFKSRLEIPARWDCSRKNLQQSSHPAVGLLTSKNSIGKRETSSTYDWMLRTSSIASFLALCIHVLSLHYGCQVLLVMHRPNWARAAHGSRFKSWVLMQSRSTCPICSWYLKWDVYLWYLRCLISFAEAENKTTKVRNLPWSIWYCLWVVIWIRGAWNWLLALHK